MELDLSDNAFGGRCADAMVPFLENNTVFQRFKLNNNGMGPAGGTIVANALLENAKRAKAADRASQLRVVVCGRNRLENGSAPAWAAAYAAHGGLREVRMPQNGIRMEGIAALAKGLAECPHLEVLDLQDNTATRSGTRAIVRQLTNWPSLREINLSDCLLGKAGGIALATSLSAGSNPKLETLKLQYGEFDRRTIELLALAISQHLKDLTTLEINGNQADPEDECIDKLREALGLHGHEDALDERESKQVDELTIVDDMEEPESDEEEEDSEVEPESDEDAEQKEAEAEGISPEAKAGEDDGVDAGVDDGGKPVTDKETDE